MKIFLISSTTLAGILACASPAFSQDISSTMGSAQFYGGIHIGGVWGEGERAGFGGTIDSDTTFRGGALAGIEFTNGMFVYGVEADVGFGRQDITLNLVPSCGNTICSSDLNGHLRGRIGIKFDNITAFLAGGLAVSKFKLGNSSITKFKAGYSIGGGVQYQLNDRWDIRVEFLHDKYSAMTDPSISYVNSDWSDNTVRAAAIFKF